MHTACRRKRASIVKGLVVWKHSSTFVRLRPEIGYNELKGHGNGGLALKMRQRESEASAKLDPEKLRDPAS